MNVERLAQFMLIALSSNSANEASVAIAKINAELKKEGKDIHWLGDQIKGKSNGGGGFFRQTQNASQQDIDRAYARGVQAGLRSNNTDAAYKRGKAEGYAEGVKVGAWAKERSGGGDWEPNSDPLEWNEPDPQAGNKVPPWRWAVWLLCKRSSRLTSWEREFCTSIATQRLTVATLSPRQEEILRGIIGKLR